MRSLRTLLPLATTLALASTGSAQTVLTLIADIDVTQTATLATPEHIGTNPTAVAWNGTDLWLAGSNNDPNNNYNCGIVKVSNALGPARTFGTAFGVRLTSVFRGYTGLAIDKVNHRLVASYDDGSTTTNGLSLWDLSTGSQVWIKNVRGSSGAAFDPGFPGGNPALGTGVAWSAFGSGRRALQDPATGADVWTLSNGMIFSYPGQTTFWRDLDFDPDTGDIWGRSTNDVLVARRTADNATQNQMGSIVVDLFEFNYTNQQNLEFVRTPTGSIVIYNDRSNASVTQLMIEDPAQPGAPYVVKAVRPDGAPESLAWDPSFAPPNGSGSYDFDYDVASGTLAINDSHNRHVYVFQVTVPPAYPYGDGCVGSNGRAPTLGISGTIAAARTIAFDLADAPANAPSQVILGLTTNFAPLPLTNCTVLIDNIVGAFPVQITSSAGTASSMFVVPPFVPPVAFTAQGVVADGGLGTSLPITLTNGVRVAFP